MSLAFFTVVTGSYLARARVLADSVLRQHPQADFYVVMADRPDPADAEVAGALKRVYLDELGLPRPGHFVLRYDVLELCTAIKPYGLAWILRNTSAQRVIYLDPDIYALSPFTPVLDALDAGAMAVITPHLTAPLDDGKLPAEREILRSGAYNLGFIAVDRAGRGELSAFIDWWCRRLERQALVDPQAGLFTDQKWIDLAPGMFAGIAICRDTTLNLAYWNLMQRRVEKIDGRWRVDGRPLVFAHFSGMDPLRPGMFSIHQNRYTRANCGAIGPLFDEYIARLLAAGDSACRQRPYAWSRLADGSPIVPAMRAAFRRQWDQPGTGTVQIVEVTGASGETGATEAIEATGATGAAEAVEATVTSEAARVTRAANTAQAAGAAGVLALTAADFNRPTPCVPRYPRVLISHLMYECWIGDARLRAMFDLSRQADQARYAHWFGAHARQTWGLAPALVPVQADLPRPAAWAAGPAHRVPRVRRWALRTVHGAYVALPPTLKNLVRRYRPLALRDYVRSNVVPLLHDPVYRPVAGHSPRAGSGAALTVVGYLGYTFGLGETGRAMARACLAADVEIGIHDLPLQGRGIHADPLLDGYRDAGWHAHTQLFCINPDAMLAVPPDLRRTAHPGRYRIGYWFWELDEFPAQWLGAFDEVDEVWAGSPFIQASLAAASDKPVPYMPPPVEFEMQRKYRRAEFGLPEDKFLFLFTYDFDSFVERKNPRACIAAFRQAFAPGRGDVALAIKVLHAGRHAEAWEELRALAREDARVVLLDMSLSRDESYGLLSVCDTYLSLHRSEGFGLGMAEAMFLGKPVVATGYSGNLGFMRPDNSCLVEYRMVPVGPSAYLYGEGKYWAEPDTAHAAQYLRRLVEDEAYRSRIGERAAQWMRAEFSNLTAGARIKRRLELLAARRAGKH